MLVTCVTSPISATPVISPNPAVISGMPAATSEPNVNSRMISAATDANQGRRAYRESLGVLHHLSAGGDLQAGHIHGVDLIEHRLAGGIRHAGWPACRS